MFDFFRAILMISMNALTISGIIYDVIVEPPSVGSTTDEHGHSRPVIRPHLTRRQNYSMINSTSFLGCFHAISSQWSIYYGRFGKQFSVHHRRSWLHHYGSNSCTWKAKAQSNSADFNGIFVYSRLVLHNMDIHANETSWLFAAINAWNLTASRAFRKYHLWSQN